MPRLEGETYFDNFGQSGHDEMREWTPRYYQRLKEADASLQFAGKTIDQMAWALENFCRNQFIATMDEEMISREEKFYGINNSDRTLEERRQLLAAAKLGTGKVNVDRIKRIIKVYAGADCQVEFIHSLDILIESGGSQITFTDFMDIIGTTIPAQLGWHVDQEMSQPCNVKVGTATTAVYIAAPITDMHGDREREVTQPEYTAQPQTVVIDAAPVQ